nr:hypothetical protein [Patescibacteria group bacterium]
AQVASKYGVKTSHTGTLDPMAEGVVIVLLGDDRLKKYEYAAWSKVYEFDLVFGISTDTFDALGLTTGIDISKQVPEASLSQVLKNMVGNYTQTVPIYSTIKVHGAHLHQYARASREVQLPKRSGEIFELEVLSLLDINFVDLVLDIDNKIEMVQGDFRQVQILQNWNTLASMHPTIKIQMAKLRVKMSKGLYVRSLSQDICSHLDCLGFAHNIVRVSNGVYTRQSCISIIDLPPLLALVGN